MKKIYVTAIWWLLGFTALAQPQFTSSNCFQLNDTAKLGFAVVSQSFDGFISQTGSNYTWDFTATGTPGPWTSWINPTIAYKFQPASASIHTPFASSQINEYASVAFPRDHFYTYSTAQDTLYIEGFYNSSNKIYQPRIPYLTFPLSYSDSIFIQTTQTGGTALGPGLITRYWKYDGFGTVQFPYGTESNVYRIRTKQIDSSTVLSSVLATNEELIWFRQDGIPILRFVKQGPSTIAAYYGFASATSGIHETEYSNLVYVFPNPTSGLFNVKSETIISQLEVVNMLGKVIYSEKLNTTETQLDLSNQPKGVYFLKVMSEDNQVANKKIIVQ